MSSLQSCEFSGCHYPPQGRKFCKSHNQQLRRSGQMRPLAPRHGTIPLATRFWSKAVRGDGCWQWIGPTRPQGYGVFTMNGSHKYAHRVAWELENGPIPDGLLIDHICFNPLCVRVSHLRLVTPKLNNEYQHRGRRKVPESGVRGVYRNRDKWIARVKHYGKVHNIGSFASQDDAAAAVTKLRHELFTYPEYQEA